MKLNELRCLKINTEKSFRRHPYIHFVLRGEGFAVVFYYNLLKRFETCLCDARRRVLLDFRPLEVVSLKWFPSLISR
ncbi:MAG: hypothetical protein JRD43_09255 [Deltaproteobacteria bacterium]|nr:hypothetical protein [Deltaproteobacteria bacterium]